MKSAFIIGLKKYEYLKALKEENETCYQILSNKIEEVKSALNIKDNELAIYYLLEFLQSIYKFEFSKFNNIAKGVTYHLKTLTVNYLVESTNIETNERKWKSDYDWIKKYLYRLNLKKLLKEL